MKKMTPKTRMDVSGFSLIEMMIALTIGLLVIAALTGVVISGSRSSKSNDRTADMQNGGRYAMDVLKRDIQHAGHHGLTGAEIISSTQTVTNECVAGFALNLRQSIFGANATNPYAATCIPAHEPNTDILVVRYVSLNSTPSTPGVAPTISAPLTANTYFFRSAYGVGTIYQGTAAPTSMTQEPQQDHTVETHVYYIRPFTVSATESPLIPALCRVILDKDGTMTNPNSPEVIASGIDQLQLRYGVLNADGTLQYLDANAVDAAANGATTTANNWDRVRAVQLWLTARSNRAEENAYVYSGNDMGDINAAASVANGTSHFRRQMFTSTIQMRN